MKSTSIKGGGSKRGAGPKMTGSAAGGLGRIEKSDAAPKTGAGKTGKAL